ncbi:putative porin [Pararobbsia alpina]|uniref:putative porin n=1 Tax=Pararobbsia alpina TaxID=621374 RepID=UPI0039A4D26D
MSNITARGCRNRELATSRFRHTRACTAVLAAMSFSVGAHAQSLATQAADNAAATAAPTENTVINLINLLVKRGVLTQQNANDLIHEAQTEAAQAKAAAANSKPSGVAVAGVAAQPGEVAVPYVPEVVRDQIKEQVKQEVIAQAKSENWATPNTFPDWVSRITISGDVRVRDEYHFYSPNNFPDLINYAAINATGPQDVNQNTIRTLPPIYNTTQNRDNLLRARARLGIDANISEQLTVGMQLASGPNNFTTGPVSTTQTLGGGFDPKAIWLNKVYASYTPTSWMNIKAGRFDNPFFSSDLLFSNDLEFDGIAATFAHALPTTSDVTLFGTLGVFPIQYTTDLFPTDSPDKGSGTQWLLGAQIGAKWKIDSRNTVKGAIAYYDFQNMKGEFSSPCALYLGATSCSTDNDAPAFMQKGNTLIALRNILPDPTLGPGLTPLPELFGLAYNYRLFDTKVQWDTRIADSYKLRLDGEYVRNLAYNGNDAFKAPSQPANNYSTPIPNPTQADYQSGPNGFMFKATLGDPEVTERGQWNFSLTYKYLQPDAVLDGFDDPDFNLGGTNAKGYIIGGQYGIARNAYLSARYLSAHEVFGPPVSIDVLQLELDARF